MTIVVDTPRVQDEYKVLHDKYEEDLEQYEAERAVRYVSPISYLLPIRIPSVVPFAMMLATTGLRVRVQLIGHARNNM